MNKVSFEAQAKCKKLGEFFSEEEDESTKNEE